jgi:hypothetical protein
MGMPFAPVQTRDVVAQPAFQPVSFRGEAMSAMQPTGFGGAVAGGGRAVIRALPGAGRVAGSALGAATGGMVPSFGGGARGAGNVNRSAAIYCRRHPQWCTQVGGVGAVASLVGSGQLPPIRRRRGRGISSRDLRAFGRVNRLLSRFVTMRRHVHVRSHPRKGG